MTAPAPAPPLRNPLETLVGYQLRRASHAVMADLGRDLEAIGLTPGEASVLLLIAANPGVTQSDVGRVLGIQRANMAPVTARLDARGLLRRERVDGRSHGLVTTDEGAALSQAARAAMDRHEGRAFGALAAVHRRALLDALASLRSQGED